MAYHPNNHPYATEQPVDALAVSLAKFIDGINYALAQVDVLENDYMVGEQIEQLQAILDEAGNRWHEIDEDQKNLAEEMMGRRMVA